MCKKIINIDLELRHLEAFQLDKLASIIDQANGWNELLDCLTRPMPPNADGMHLQPLNLSLDSINLIKQQFYCGKSPALALLNHWSITGRRRPTVKSLLYYLSICKLERAADYVRQTILGVDLFIEDKAHTITNINRPLSIEQTKGYIVDNAFKFEKIDEIIDNLQGEHKRFSFSAIYKSTNKFCHQPYNSSANQGTRIGDGKFSSVFRALTHVEPNGSQQIIAAKLLKSECNRQYLANEINLAKRIKHANLLELLGISIDYENDDNSIGYICLIYPYIQNGSLLACLSNGLSCRHMKHLNWTQRFNVAVGVASGIAYLHTFEDGPIIHRDIKTANILIDVDLNPKVGDFTLVRQLDTLRGGDTQYSMNVIGTSIYMPPEAFRGDISTKFDIFSFGVVLLELLTGLKPFNGESDEDLLTYINEKLSDIDENSTSGIESNNFASENSRDKFLREILDVKAGQWNFGLAKKMFELALKATESRKRDRPEIEDILSTLESI